MPPFSVAPDEPSRIESHLHAQLAAAAEAYQNAKTNATRLYQIAKDMEPNQTDGNLAIRNAVRSEREALARYAEAIRQFNDFILRRKLPRDLPEK